MGGQKLRWVEFEQFLNCLVFGVETTLDQVSQSTRKSHLPHSDQCMLRRGCAFAQPRLSIHCSHTQNIEINDDSDQITHTRAHCVALHMRLICCLNACVISAVFMWTGPIKEKSEDPCTVSVT